MEATPTHPNESHKMVVIITIVETRTMILKDHGVTLQAGQRGGITATFLNASDKYRQELAEIHNME
jgi:hypothetical protein